ncbi:hypothetical protein GP475_09080 [Corynebacterium poyangense]|uniref:ABC-2 type transporter transmembrane domain-containing protein n=1 Tax=Corynebacterium poyangense TaxID=2684405 RepID=A0A7H0SQF3_9CORY|nr:YhgE/Pip domain-containing protein [Corynebacterium poyangense]QNQ90778.1 hypothetical protein GP475_09080 [Corynebacterium poyangense]
MSLFASAAPAPRNPRRIFFRVVLILVLVAPLLVAAAFMWSLWDPSHYLKDVKLAVVNEDTGADQDGKHVNFGDDVVNGLMNTDYLNFEQVSAEEADTGLRDEDYMVVLSIPRNFSQEVATVVDPQPHQAEVVISYNDHYGTNTPLLTSGLVPGIEQGVQKGISEGYAAKILGGINQLGAGLNKAAGGAKQLDDGMTQLKDGTSKAVDGTAQLKDGTEQMRDGSARLDDGMSQLVSGTGQLGEGSAKIDDGVGQLTGKLIPLLQQAGGVAAQLRPVVDSLERAGLHEQAENIRQQISVLDSGNPEAMVNKLQQLKDGTALMRYNLNDPSAPYLSGVLQLKDGTAQLRDGAVRLDDGMGQMKDGAHQLDDGARRLKEGTSLLNSGLADGAAKAPQIRNIESSSQQIAVPVNYSEDYRHPVQTLSDVHNPTSKVLSQGVTLILILVFGYLAMALVSMLAPHILGIYRHKGAAKPVLAGFALVGLVNLIIMGLLTWTGMSLDFHPSRPWAYALAIFMIATNGTACFQMLRVVFGQLVGAAFSLGFFAYGVFCFGGVWPSQLTPGPLRALHAFHPMSYARDAYIRAVDANIDSVYYRGIIVLGMFTLCFLGISIYARSIQLARLAQDTEETQSEKVRALA